jgi:hypothetical protein
MHHRCARVVAAGANEGAFLSAGAVVAGLVSITANHQRGRCQRPCATVPNGRSKDTSTSCLHPAVPPRMPAAAVPTRPPAVAVPAARTVRVQRVPAHLDPGHPAARVRPPSIPAGPIRPAAPVAACSPPAPLRRASRPLRAALRAAPIARAIAAPPVPTPPAPGHRGVRGAILPAATRPCGQIGPHGQIGRPAARAANARLT